MYIYFYYPHSVIEIIKATKYLGNDSTVSLGKYNSRYFYSTIISTVVKSATEASFAEAIS
jgi:hypothetical protein